MEGHHHLDQHPQPPTVKIFCHANEGYCLSIRDGQVVLALANPLDPFQHWIKDTRHSTKVKDVEGRSAFSLVNKATGEAIKHSLGDKHPVRLVLFNPQNLDESVLWTESGNVRNGFRCIRMVNNISLTLDALGGHVEVHDGTSVVNWPCWNGDNQIWKMVSYGYDAIPNPIHGAPISLCTPCVPVVFGHHPCPLAVSSQPPMVKIFCGANEGYHLSIRDGKVVLASANPHDPFQHWIKEMRHSTKVKDVEGRPAFALVNKSTGEAIKQSLGDRHPVRLVPFNPHDLDESVLWTESSNVRNGFRYIRMVNNISLTLDVIDGQIHDGAIVINWPCINGENQIWKMVPHGDEAIPNLIHGAPISLCTPCVPVGFGHHPRPLAASSQPQTVKIFCRANERYCLSIRDGKVILASANPHDPFQHWIKEMRHSTKVKDVEGRPAFALVNKATGEVIKQSLGDTHPVHLVPFNPHDLDESMLWTESSDVRDGFKCIRMVNNISSTLDALAGHVEVHDGTSVVNWQCWNGDNQIWKMVPYDDEAIPNPTYGAPTSCCTIHVASCRL
ncbi:Ricin B-like lectin R40G2 [Rhynchospora pubera]|uniref:Ricin B-like lectin R40G2 n=1 Tax=Rhynchospora pubera TaxID=906938 RepID=A0AAV8DLF3_9POAL|nr:Ricin B-like lectin R40G2 [Rhynchospora pubera]